MRQLVVVLSLALVTASTTRGQQGPLTKIEQFQSKAGTVIVKGMSDVGIATSELFGTLTVEARQFTDAANPKVKVGGVRISIELNDRAKRSAAVFVDADEIDGLLQGLSYIEKVNKDVTTMQDFEVEYQTKGELSVVAFSDSKGIVNFAVQIGRISKTSLFCNAAFIGEFRALLLKAKTLL